MQCLFFNKAAEKASNISAVQWITNSVDGSNMYPGGVWSTEGIRTTRKANNTVTAVVQLRSKVRSNKKSVKVFQGNFGILLVSLLVRVTKHTI